MNPRLNLIEMLCRLGEQLNAYECEMSMSEHHDDPTLVAVFRSDTSKRTLTVLFLVQANNARGWAVDWIH